MNKKKKKKKKKKRFVDELSGCSKVSDGRSFLLSKTETEHTCTMDCGGVNDGRVGFAGGGGRCPSVCHLQADRTTRR